MPAKHKRAVERRMHTGTTVRFERRAKAADEQASAEASDGLIIGHAAVFDVWTTLYEGRYWLWREIVRKGAFANAIQEKQDVRALFNHDPNFVLGRTTSGTLELAEDNVSLLSKMIPPGTQTIRDLVIAPMERKDITGMSFGFLPRIADETTRTENKDGTTVLDRGGDRITYRYEGEKLIMETELLDLDMFDVSVVTFPQYEDSDCEISERSIPDLRSLIAEHDKPHVRQIKTPSLDECRRLMEARAEARANRQGAAAAGPKRTTSS